MPQAYVSKLAKENNISLQEAEAIWENAKAAAGLGKKDKEPNWALITTIFKRMMHERSSKYKDSGKKKQTVTK